MSFLGQPVDNIVKASVPINEAIVQEIANFVFPVDPQKKDYESFIAAYKSRPEFTAKSQEEQDAELAQVGQKLKSIIKRAIGPMQYGTRMTEYLASDVDNKSLFEFVKLLLSNREEFSAIIKNLSEIDVNLHQKGNQINEKEVKDLVEALINLQANALLAMVKPDIAPVVSTPMDALVTDIRRKIDTVNELLQVKPLVGGGENNRDLIKYMKYKAKYLRLKSKMQ